MNEEKPTKFTALKFNEPQPVYQMEQPVPKQNKNYNFKSSYLDNALGGFKKNFVIYNQNQLGEINRPKPKLNPILREKYTEEEMKENKSLEGRVDQDFFDFHKIVIQEEKKREQKERTFIKNEKRQAFDNLVGYEKGENTLLKGEQQNNTVHRLALLLKKVKESNIQPVERKPEEKKSRDKEPVSGFNKYLLIRKANS